MNMVNVRHILAKFEGGTTDSTTGVTTYSTEEKAAALKEITTVQEQWLANGGNEDAFTALVKDNSDDTGSKENGGLYENIYPGQMVEAFNNWCFAERKAGDYEIVETEYGYHLIFFVGEADTTFRSYMVENTLRNNDFDAWYAETTEAAAAKELNTKYLSLDMILSNG
jgi:parvulin-like peptidyl-prolyl isomerase